jgi:hypothetical protein
MPSKPSTQKPNGSQHLAPTTDTKAPTADTNEQTERIDYYKAVAEIRELFTQVDEAERGYYRIGQLVYEVMQDAKYGDRTLTTLAKDTGRAKCTLDRYLNVYRSWKGILAPGPKMPSYAVLRELAPHADDPECKKVVQHDPNITKSEALALKRRLKDAASSSASGHQQGKSQNAFAKDKRGYLKAVSTKAEELRKLVEQALGDTDEQLDALAEIAGKLTLSNLRADCKMGVDLAEILQERLRQLEEKDESEQAEPEGANAVATEQAHPEASVQGEA